MKILIDAEEIAGARTGIPRVTFLDAIMFTQIFNKLDLYVSKQGMESLRVSDEMQILINQSLVHKSCEVGTIPQRPRNPKVWALQLMGGIALKSNIQTEFTYSTLFPAMFREAINRTEIIRLFDPFNDHSISRINQVIDGNGKQVLARELRERAFRSKIHTKSIFVTISQRTRKLFSEIYMIPEDRFEVIWPSVGFRSGLGIQDALNKRGEKYIVCVMSQRQRKNPLFIINNWSKIAKKLDYNLYIVGKIPKQELSELAKRYLRDNRLRIFEDLNSEDLVTLQKNALASIFASTGEGFGMPIAESLLYGVPVIHNDLEVFREVSGDAGTTFSLSSDESLVRVLEDLGQNQEMHKELVIKSWNRGASFSHENAANQWKRMFEKYNPSLV